jgi:hypothetical protein
MRDDDAEVLDLGLFKLAFLWLQVQFMFAHAV